jgi:uncharacterized protein UPF0016
VPIPTKLMVVAVAAVLFVFLAVGACGLIRRTCKWLSLFLLAYLGAGPLALFGAELTEKTALASLALAKHLPPRQVIVGARLAFLVQTGVAVIAASVLQLFPTETVRSPQVSGSSILRRRASAATSRTRSRRSSTMSVKVEGGACRHGSPAF